ncbi:MAG: transporter substrate-binding domain-containing protein [Balneolales bacterium]
MLNKLLFTVFSIFMFLGCYETGNEQRSSYSLDLDEIKERGTLYAITSYSPLSYFIYRGQPMGYEYELLKLLAKELEVDLELVVARDIDHMIDMLNEGEGDLIAYSLTILNERAERVSFTTALNTTRQVLVQRKPEGWRSMKLHEIEQSLTRNPIELKGETIFVRKGSSYVPRLHNLAQEIGDVIHVIEASGEQTTDDLIRLVAEDSLRYTVSDENIAKVNQSYYPDIDVNTAISLPQQTAWAVRKNSPGLLEEVNQWINEIQMQSDFYAIYNKYFENSRAYRNRADSDFLSFQGGRISEYDDLIVKYAKNTTLDWKLIAALIYQESQFNPSARSWAGATGLMQLMPRTARAYGANNPSNPDENIQAGSKFLEWLEGYWHDKIQDEDERMKFVLASYNVGQGHVQDARRLTNKYNGNPDVWDEVAEFLLKKSDKEYYNDEVVHYGYCRGEEPVNYVGDIMYIYSHYKRAAMIYEMFNYEPELAVN